MHGTRVRGRLLLLLCPAAATTPMSCMSAVILYVSSLKDGDSCNELRGRCYYCVAVLSADPVLLLACPRALVLHCLWVPCHLP